MDEQLSLINLANGGAMELFEDALGKAIENIKDPNTEAAAKRKIVLTVTIKPVDDERRECRVVVEAKTTLAAPMGVGGTIAVGIRRGQPIAVATDTRQLQMDWDEESRLTSLGEAKEAGE